MAKASINGKYIEEIFVRCLHGLEHIVGEGNVGIGPRPDKMKTSQLRYSSSTHTRRVFAHYKDKSQLFYVYCINNQFAERVQRYLERENQNWK